VVERYFIVGSRVVLQGKLRREDSSLTLTARIGGESIARLAARRGSGLAEVEIARHPLADAAAVAEAAQLFVRLVVKLWAGRFSVIAVDPGDAPQQELDNALRDDGFARVSAEYVLAADATDFARTDKVNEGDMDGIYADPLSVPWNYVPVTTDLLEKAIATTSRGARILDLGCGYGKNLQLLLRSGRAAIGLDVSRAAVERAREVLGNRTTIVVGSATELPWRAGHFDAIVDAGCIHCLTTSERVIAVREAARVLASSGVLYSAVLPPRDSRWLARQPFAASTFGVPADAVAQLLRRTFRVVEVDARPHITNAVARRPYESRSTK
jgi:SAM-dependent methyltransferase